MKNTILILAVLISHLGCESANKQGAVIELETKERINLIHEKITQNCKVEFASRALEKIVKFLKSEDYTSNSTILDDDLTISYKDQLSFKDVEKNHLSKL